MTYFNKNENIYLKIYKLQAIWAQNQTLDCVNFCFDADCNWISTFREIIVWLCLSLDSIFTFHLQVGQYAHQSQNQHSDHQAGNPPVRRPFWNTSCTCTQVTNTHRLMQIYAFKYR